MLRLLIAFLLGAGLASGVFTFVTEDSRFVWVIIVAAVIVLVTILMALVLRPRKAELNDGPSWQDHNVLGGVVAEQPKQVRNVSFTTCALAFVVGAGFVLIPVRGELMDAWDERTPVVIEGDDDVPRHTTQPNESTQAPAPSESTEPEQEPINYFSSGLPEQIEAMKEAGPSAETTGVMVRPDWITYDLATAPGESTIDDWEVNDGVIEHQGAAHTPSDPGIEFFSLDEISWDKVPAMVDEAFKQTGWTYADLNGDPYVIIERSPFWGDDYPVTVRVYLPNERESHYVVFTPDGVFIEVV